MEDEQDVVAAVLGSMPRAEARGDFVARVNARIDATAGWLGLADFRAWTLGLAPAACVLALIAFFWQAPSSSAVAPPATATETSQQASGFSPASTTDWQKDVNGDALLDAALTPGGRDAR